MKPGSFRGYKIHLSALCVIAVLLIIIYGIIIRHTQKKDILECKIVNIPTLSIDGWGALHIFFFMLLGLLFPRKHMLVLTIGIGWEIIETILGQCKIMVGGKRLKLIGDQDEEGRPTGDDDAYWYGRSSDVLMNSVGYIIGDYLKCLN